MILFNLYKKGSIFLRLGILAQRKKIQQQLLILQKKIKKIMNSSSKISISKKKYFHEAGYLSLDSTKSKKFLKWKKFLNLDETLKFTVDWF